MGLILALLLIPYFGWGIYTLQHRYRYHEELSAKLEATTIAGVVVFYVVALSTLRSNSQEDLIFFVFALLGLIVSGAALYGHVAVSLTSRLVVDFYTPAGDNRDTPRLGPARALEREGDLEGAIQEYLVLARIYPKAPEVHARLGECHLRADRPAEAAAAFERVARMSKKPEDAVVATSRVAEIYEHKLGEPDKARGALEAFLKRFPAGSESDTIRERLGRGKPEAKPPKKRPTDLQLSAMDEISGEEIQSGIEEAETEDLSEVRPPTTKKQKSTGPVEYPVKSTGEAVEMPLVPSVESESRSTSSLEALADIAQPDMQDEPDDEDAVSKSNTKSWGLESLDTAAPIQLDDKPAKRTKPKKSALSLEPLNPDEKAGD